MENKQKYLLIIVEGNKNIGDKYYDRTASNLSQDMLIFFEARSTLNNQFVIRDFTFSFRIIIEN